jgi:hypothetical protein
VTEAASSIVNSVWESAPATLFSICPRVTENEDQYASLRWRAFLLTLEPILVISLQMERSLEIALRAVNQGGVTPMPLFHCPARTQYFSET